MPALKLFQNGWATEYLVKEIFHTHKTYANKMTRRRPRTTTDSGGPQRRQPLHTQAQEDEEPRQFIRSDDRDDDDEALYEPANEDEELRRFATSRSCDEPRCNVRSTYGVDWSPKCYDLFHSRTLANEQGRSPGLEEDRQK